LPEFFTTDDGFSVVATFKVQFQVTGVTFASTASGLRNASLAVSLRTELAAPTPR